MFWLGAALGFVTGFCFFGLLVLLFVGLKIAEAMFPGK